MKHFLSDLIRVGISNLSIMLFGIGTSVLTARLLTPAENGDISALLVYPSLFMVLGSLGIRQSTTYFVGKAIYPLEVIQKAVVQIWMITTLLCMVSCYVLITYFTRHDYAASSVWLAILSIPFSLYNTYSSGVFLGKNEIKNFNRINWIPNAVTFLATIGLLYYFQLRLDGALLALLLGHVSIFMVLIFRDRFFSHLTLRMDMMVIKSMLSLGIVFALSLLVSQLNYKIDVILLENMSSSYELGIYTKGTSVVQYLWQIPMLFSTIIFARSAVSKDSLAFSKKVCQLLRISLVLIGFLSLGIGLLAYPIIHLLFGSAFDESAPVMQILLPGVVLLTVFKVMNMDLAGKGKPWISLKSMWFPLILNVVLNVLLIPRYGSVGAAMSSLVTYSLASFFFLHFYSKETGIPVADILRYQKSDWEPILYLFQKLAKKQ